ncbi:LA_2478/LA_2722/LA_4182 family protein [Leptospira broomii]|uniref:LA_2478/LA_2722/LA_4182 family protein n=1 Tax=Leptospira broomii TaxID=301541 RepID=UPI000594F17C|nr:lipoprotein [Leptospira broomii]
MELMNPKIIVFFLFLSLFVSVCRKGPSLSREEVKNLSSSYIRELCRKNLECSAMYLESLSVSEQEEAKSEFYSLEQCMENQKDQSILPDDYEKVTDEQIAKVRRCMDDLLKTPCASMEESGGIPSCQDLFRSIE